MLLVHPEGQGSKVDNKALNISFEPTPDYAGIAKAASNGKCWAGCVRNVEELQGKLKEAVEVVRGKGGCAGGSARCGGGGVGEAVQESAG